MPAFRYRLISFKIVVDDSADSVHQNIVVDPVEEFGQVHFNDPSISIFDVLLSSLHCLLAVPSLSEPITFVRELILERVSNGHHYGLLDCSVQESWNS